MHFTQQVCNIRCYVSACATFVVTFLPVQLFAWRVRLSVTFLSDERQSCSNLKLALLLVIVLRRLKLHATRTLKITLCTPHSTPAVDSTSYCVLLIENGHGQPCGRWSGTLHDRERPLVWPLRGSYFRSQPATFAHFGRCRGTVFDRKRPRVAAAL